MRYGMMAAVAVVTMASAPAMAQQADVNSYLCTFAGKCGTDPANADDTATKDAPATKGFRLANAQGSASQQSPTMAAPATKGFRLAASRPQEGLSASGARGSRFARSTSSAMRTPRLSESGRRYAAAGTVAPAPGAAGSRADLMLQFQLGSDQMTPAAEQKARGFAQALNMAELKDKRFLIEGHTDARGSRDLNLDLSRRRAQSVADFLVTQGVERARVEVKGVGPDQPLPGHSKSSQANRRVEAVLLS